MFEKLKRNHQTMHGYKILNDGQMEKAIINLEKICLICGYNHVTYIDKEEYNKHDI